MPAPLITGKDLLEKGLKPGPAFNRVLKSLYEAVLDGKVAGKEEELEFVTFLIKKNKICEEAGEGDN